MASLAVLGLGLLLAWTRGLLRERALWLGLAGFAALTVVFDVVMTQAGLYSYAGWSRSGLGVARMPVEDLLYGLALYLVAVSTFGGRLRAPQ